MNLCSGWHEGWNERDEICQVYIGYIDKVGFNRFQFQFKSIKSDCPINRPCHNCNFDWFDILLLRMMMFWWRPLKISVVTAILKDLKGKFRIASVRGWKYMEGFIATPVKIVFRKKGKNSRKTCEECGKSFSFQKSLKIHMESGHFGITYPCHICEKDFKQKSNLPRHLLTETHILAVLKGKKWFAPWK